MQQFGHPPYAANHKPMNMTVWRLAMVVAAIFLGSVLALITASESLREAGSFVDNILLGHFSGRGLIVFAAVLSLALAYIRFEWPHWTLLIVGGAMWWGIHSSKAWTKNRLMKELIETRTTLGQPMKSR